jgi:hypothetical protein
MCTTTVAHPVALVAAAGIERLVESFGCVLEKKTADGIALLIDESDATTVTRTVILVDGVESNVNDIPLSTSVLATIFFSARFTTTVLQQSVSMCVLVAKVFAKDSWTPCLLAVEQYMLYGVAGVRPVTASESESPLSSVA